MNLVKRMSREEDLERAIVHFINYLKARGFSLDLEAQKYLSRYVEEEERKEKILVELSRKEKTFEDLIEGFSKLARRSSEIAISDRRTTITTDDVKKAIEQLFCGVWPFCK